MIKNIVLDFVSSHSAGKTTVMNGVSEILRKEGRRHNIIKSESRIIDLEIYDRTDSGTQALISLFNWGNALKSSIEFPITMCTDWAVRTLAYTMCSDKIDNRVVNMHKQWLDLLHSKSLISGIIVYHFYIPIEFPMEDDGLRKLDENYREKVDRSIKYVFNSCKIPYKTLIGTREERVLKVINFINDIMCYNC